MRFKMLFLLLLSSCGDNGPAGDKVSGRPDFGARDASSPERILAEGVKDFPKPLSGDIDISKLEWIEMKYKIVRQKLSGIWGSLPTDLWGAGLNGVILHYDGKEWSPMFSGVDDDIYGIWGRSSNEIYAISTFAALRYDGKNWKKIKNIWSRFTAVAGLQDGGPWITDSDSNIIWEPIDIERDVWRMTVPQGWDQRFKIHAIWPYSKDDIYFVGEEGKVLRLQYGGNLQYFRRGVVYKLRACIFSLLPPIGVNVAIRGLWGTSPKNIYAVGADGAIFHYGGSQWKKIEISDSYFYGVWGTSPSDIYVVGHPIFKKDESIFHFDGINWNKMPPARSANLSAVFGFSDKEIFAVGEYAFKKNNF